MTTYRIVAYPPTDKMVVAVWQSMPLCTSDLQECIADMLAASPQPDTVLTAQERREVLQKTAEGIDDFNIIMTHWQIVARAVESAVLRKLGGKP